MATPHPEQAAAEEPTGETVIETGNGPTLEHDIKALVAAVTTPTGGLCLSILGFLLFILRCLAVTNWDTAVAREVFMHTGLTTALQVVAFVVLPLTIALGSPFFGLLGGEAVTYRLWRKAFVYFVLGVTCAIIGLNLASPNDAIWNSRLFFLGLAAYQLFVMFLAWMMTLGRTSARGFLVPLGIIVFLIMFLGSNSSYSLLSDHMWLTRERFQAVDGRTLDVYVLETRGDDYFVLGENPRKVSLVSKADVKAKSICVTPEGSENIPNPVLKCQEKPALTSSPTESKSR